MEKLVVITYDQFDTAEQAFKELQKLEKEFLIDLEDAAYITKNQKGDVKLHQAANLTAAGATGGAMWGLLFGILVFAPLAGALIGAGTGALVGGLSDYGVDDKFIKDVVAKMGPNTSALFMLVRHATADKVLPAMAQYGGEVAKTSLPADTEQKLRQALEKYSKQPVATPA